MNAVNTQLAALKVNTGLTTLNGTLTVGTSIANKATNITGTLEALDTKLAALQVNNGLTKLNGALTVSSDTTVSGTLNTANTTLGVLKVEGETTIEENLGVFGDIVLTGVLEAGETSIDGLLSIGGNLIVTGNFDLEHTGGTFDINSTFLTNGTFTSKALDIDAPTTGFTFKMQEPLINDKSKVFVVNDGDK